MKQTRRRYTEAEISIALEIYSSNYNAEKGFAAKHTITKIATRLERTVGSVEQLVTHTLRPMLGYGG